MTIDVNETLRDEATLRAALAEADIAPLLMVLVHLTGDPAPLDEVGPYITGPWNFMEQVPAALKLSIHERIIAALRDYAETGRPFPAAPPPNLSQRMMSTCVGQPVPPEYVPLILEETQLAGADPRSVQWRGAPPAARNGFRVVIVGAGLAGLCMGMKLAEAGIDFVILEKNDTVGGTWYENTYPGCGVDTPNHFFSFSFAPNHDWTEHFSKRQELWNYLERCADDYKLRPRIRFKTEVVAARYDEDAALWRITANDPDGTPYDLAANALITAVGQLNRPLIPEIPGVEDFAGPAFHTARWDQSQDLTGKRVAMIGTGASGMQAAPSIAGDVAHLSIFQRTPHWAVHNPNYHRRVSDGKRFVLKNLPFYAQWYRFQLFWASGDGLHASLHVDPEWNQPEQSLNKINHGFREMLIAHMRKELEDDPVLLAKVVPSYPPYGKRMLRDNHWYKMLKQPHVDLVTDPIERITRNAIVTRDGAEHPADVIVFATGFQAGRMLWPMEITGRNGANLRALWGDDDPRAYLGITAPAFPNLFMLYGPNTNLGHGGSIIFHVECQVRYIMQGLREMLENGHKAMECRVEPHDSYNDRVDAAHQRMVWAHGGVGNWYKNARGRVIANSPWRLVDYWEMTATLDPADYVFS